MSWLYTIVFAGLLISSGSEAPNGVETAPNYAEVIDSPVQRDEIETYEQTYPLNPNGRVSVSNINGSITVEAWDRNEVFLSATKVADSRETLAMVDIDIEARPDHLRIESNHKGWDYQKNEQRRKIEVRYHLKVPRTAVLNEIETVNGSVSVSNFTNITKVSAVNGTVTANNLRGSAKLSTVNGEVNAEFDRLQPGNAVSLETVNGVVNLVLPSDVNAVIKADSLNGNIANDFGLPVRKGRYIGRNLHGQVGSGGVEVRLSSVNGSLSIGRKKDSGSTPPVTNLLKPGDEDDVDDGAISELPNVSREISKATRELNRSTKAAKAKVADVDKAAKDLEKLKEMEKIKVEKLRDVEVIVKDDAMEKAIEQGVKVQVGVVGRVADALWTRGQTTLEKKTNSFNVKQPPDVSVEAKRCQVRIRSWNQPSVKYVLTETRSRNRGALSLTESVSSSRIGLRIVDDPGHMEAGILGNLEDLARIEVFVPRKANINVVTDREVRVEGVAGKIELSTGDAPVNIRDSEGTLKINAGDGLIRILGFKGELDLQTVDGEVYLEGDFQRINSTASDAQITLTIPDGRNASISTNIALESEGMNLSRENGRTWKVGNGGPRYNFDFAHGRLVIRNSGNVEFY